MLILILLTVVGLPSRKINHLSPLTIMQKNMASQRVELFQKTSQLMVLLQRIRHWMVTWIKPTVFLLINPQRKYLDSLIKKDPIAWLKMSNKDDWTRFDNVVSIFLVGAPCIFEHVNLLENTIYTQGCLLFGTLPNKKKGLRGLNRRAQHSISLVQERNELLNKLNSSTDQDVISSLKLLPEHVQSQL